MARLRRHFSGQALRFLGAFALCLSIAGLLSACSEGGGVVAPPVEDASVEPDVPISTFNDHTVGEITSVDEFMALSRAGVGRRALKFVVSAFQTESMRALSFMDANFYTLHDEWYWFRLLNGERIPDVDVDPIGLSFSTISEVYAWARLLDPRALPLDLRWARSGERLYSSKFYDLALSEARDIGAGTLIFIEARQTPEPRPERWLFELEFSDKVTHPELVIFFELLEAGLPPEIAPQLHWVIRSPQQEALAVEMEAGGLRYHDRIVRYGELSVPGEVEVYSEGITAGRVLVARSADGEGIEDSTENSVLLTDIVPDYLPPATGLITSVPQTPLAHVNVLARNRGIPNLYLGGALEDPGIDQLDRIRAHVVIRAQKPDIFDMVSITRQQYLTWWLLKTKVPIEVPAVDVSQIPTTHVLADLHADDVESLRTAIGGKAAGFLGLMSPGGVTIPEDPMVITVRAYHEHLESLRPLLEEAFTSSEFRRSPRLRFLVLEGGDDYDLRYSDSDDAAYKERQIDLSEGEAIGELIAAGGFKRLLRDKPMDGATLAEIRSVLEALYGGYAVQQGLRFRSSSTVEDIEGFNGAGLYDSNTGFLAPTEQATEKDQKKSVEWAIKKTWASYWGFEAYEERGLEEIGHLSGNMAVLVHARFDDPMELSNGVFTMTLMPEGSGQRAVLEINTQRFDESVTNPDPGAGALPEVVRVVLHEGSQAPAIERVSASNRTPPGEWILSDEKLLGIFDQAMGVTLAWRQRENGPLQISQRSEVLTLDFEFREMAEGWPALVEGAPFAQRIIIKQSRSLEPGLRQVSRDLKTLPVPRDVLRRARRVETRVCNSEVFELTLIEVYTDPLMSPDMGHSVRPFTASLSAQFIEGLAPLGLIELDHTQVLRVEHPDMVDGDTWSLDVELDKTLAQDLGVARLLLDAGTYRLEHGVEVSEGHLDACEVEVLHASPEDYLVSLLGGGR